MTTDQSINFFIHTFVAFASGWLICMAYNQWERNKEAKQPMNPDVLTCPECKGEAVVVRWGPEEYSVECKEQEDADYRNDASDCIWGGTPLVTTKADAVSLYVTQAKTQSRAQNG